jgi:hypothetical protein
LNVAKFTQYGGDGPSDVGPTFFLGRFSTTGL